jgi:hypothetical protein
MRKPFLTLIILLVGMFCACTQRQQARSFGGNGVENLPAGRKLVNITWKDHNLWILTRAMRADEHPETYTFSESSAFGIVQGSVTIIEKR